MIIIHGQKKSEEKLNIVNKIICPFCKKSNNYTVTIKKTWLTIYFIPILPSKNYIKCCNECNQEEYLDKKEYSIYLDIWELNNNNHQIEEPYRREEQLILDNKLRQIFKEKSNKVNNEKHRYINLVRKMSNSELIERINNPRGYSQSFLSVVEDEMISRKL